MLASAAAIATTAKLLSPLIADIYKGAKAAGSRGLLAWEATTFPKKLARRLRAIEEVRTLWAPDKDVSLLDFYYPSRLEIDGNRETLSRLSDLKRGNYVIEGIVGQGKSIFLRYLAIQEVLSNDAKVLPLFVELRKLSQSHGLLEAILQSLSTLDVDIGDETVQYLYRSGRICLLLDGFDEIEDSLVKDTLTALETLAQRYPDLQIIVTSRPNNEIQKSPLFKKARVASLRSTDYGPFMQKLGLDATKVAVIRDAIRKSPSKLAELITTPLMLTLVVMVYESEREIPETLPEFFERLFRVVFSRHDRLKAAFNRKHHSGLSERKLQALFEAFCFMCMQNGFGRSLSHAQFQEAFDQAIQYAGDATCEIEMFKLDLTKVACLMLEEGIDTTTFLHKSIMEYYSAAFIKHSMDEVATMFYESVRGDSHAWWEVLSFLREIDAYRFSRDFSVPELKDAKQDLANLLQAPHINDRLLATLEELCPGLELIYRREGDDVRLTHFGPFNLVTRWAYKDVDTLIMRCLTEQYPARIAWGDFSEMVAEAQVGALDQADFRLPLRTMSRTYGLTKLWEAFGVLLARIEKQLCDGSKILADQQRRKLIFNKKPNRAGPDTASGRP